MEEFVSDDKLRMMICDLGYENTFWGLIEYFCPELNDFMDIDGMVLRGDIIPAIINIEKTEEEKESEEMPKKVPHKMDDATKKRILKALRANVDKDKIARIFGVTKMQVSALDAWRTMGKY
jgi:hypothetical protein